MIRIAFKILLHDTAKYLALVIGIAFSALLISQQTGIGHAFLLTSTNTIDEVNAADIWVMKPSVEHLMQTETIQEVAVNRVRSIQGVEWAVPYYMSSATLRTTRGELKGVSIVGVDDVSMVGAPVGQMVLGNVEDLNRPHAIIVDVPGYKTNFRDQPLELGRVVEIGQVRAVIVGYCRSKPNWSGSMVAYAKRSNAVAMARETESPVTFVVARAANGTTPEEVAAQITEQTGLAAYSRNQFKARTLDWMIKNSGVVENFGVTIMMGIIIGIAIVGQTFYLFSVENLKQFATLKAIGIENRRILGMILLQAVFVAVVGYCLGVGGASMFFAVFSTGEGPMRGLFMHPAIFIGTGVFVLIVTVAACLFSVRKVLVVDPAIVFRS